MSKFTTEQLADRWYDLREITNLAGKYVTSRLLKQEKTIFEDFWSAADDVCLTDNFGRYIGRTAVSGYYAAVADATAVKSQFLQNLFKEQLGNKTAEEVYGVGQLLSLPLTTPVVEIAGDGKTAKGMWNVQGSDNDITAQGPISNWSIGYLCIDFIREGDSWKIWHLMYVEDIRCPMGESWVHPREIEAEPGFEPLGSIRMPAYTEKVSCFAAYTPDRPFTPPPAVPEPYETFDKTFTYGAERS